MKKMKLIFFVIIAMYSSICFAVVSNLKNDFNQYLSYNNKYLNGVGGLDLIITDTTDVFEYYTNNLLIPSYMTDITYDVTYTADPLTTDTTYDFLAFRIFNQGQWQTHWGTTAADVNLIYFAPRINELIKSVKIDLTPFHGSDLAMGWVFVSDLPSQATILISNIKIETIDEPGTFVLLGIGLLIATPFIRKRKYKKFHGLKVAIL
jgi:hypothetical protein